jgi:hypothetical protein
MRVLGQRSPFLAITCLPANDRPPGSDDAVLREKMVEAS